MGERFTMKNRMKLAALAASVLLLLSFSACAVERPDTTSGSSAVSGSSEQEDTSSKEEVVSVDESKYEDTLDGLAEYMKAKEYISGDPVEMAADFIGAEKGVKYTGSYEGNNNITMELYEYDPANLNETAQKVIDSVKKDGKFEIMQTDVNAVLSDSGKYLMIYTDTASGEVHEKHTDTVKADFKAFKK